jgi:ABC-2 type transport system ATP-binding protein
VRTAAIEVEGLVKDYGKLRAVDGVSFSVQTGEILALLGPNGAGKTTTVEILEGFRRADAGAARVLGHDPSDHRALAPRIGVMPQDGGLYAGIRAEEALRLFASFYPRAEDPDALLHELDLDGVRKTAYRRLSGGEKQRLSLALALVGRPDVLFLDEPTAGIDVRGRVHAWETITALRDRGATVLVTTHLLEEAERLADRVAIIHRGRLVASGTLAEVRGDGAGVRFRTDQPVDPAELGTTLGVEIVPVQSGEYRIAAEPTPDLLARLTTTLAQRGILLRELRAGYRTLEEVFLELTEDDA